MNSLYIYQCEDSTEAILTAIYDAWASAHSHEENRIEVLTEEGREYSLFAEYISVTADEEKSEKVRRSVRSKISEEAYERLMKGLLSDDPEKGEVAYRFLRAAFQKGESICKDYSNPWVMKQFEQVRAYDNEVHHLKGFLRFDGQKDGSLFAVFAPKNNVTGELMEHFSDRLNTENFIILDEKRRIAGIHRKGDAWFLYRLTKEEEKKLLLDTEQDKLFGPLWETFVRSISIEARENLKLQRNNLPLRFRPYMTEFRQNA